MDDSYAAVVDEDFDGCFGVASAEADVVEVSGLAQGDWSVDFVFQTIGNVFLVPQSSVTPHCGSFCCELRR